MSGRGFPDRQSFMQDGSVADQALVGFAIVARLFEIFGFDRLGHPVDGVEIDQRDDRAAKTSTGEPSTVGALLGARDLDQSIELGRAVLEILDRAAMRFSHEFAEAGDVMTLEMFDRCEDAFILADDMRRASLDEGWHDGVGELFARDVTQGGHPEDLRGLKALITPLVLTPRRKGRA